MLTRSVKGPAWPSATSKLPHKKAQTVIDRAWRSGVDVAGESMAYYRKFEEQERKLAAAHTANGKSTLA